jgi:hypothetical protein
MRELFKYIVVFMSLLLTMFIAKCSNEAWGADQHGHPPLVVEKTQGKLIWESPDGKVRLYRVVDRMDSFVVICYQTVGELHGRTVASQCFRKPGGLY